jgi:tRNA dimethylallyltransferase
MDIGTAKPDRESMRRIPHCMIDIVDPDEKYSAYRYARDAANEVAQLHAQGKKALVCGGTGLYYNALAGGIDINVSSDQAIRDTLHRQLQRKGSEYLYRRLVQVDPKRAAQLHSNDTVRIVRALEIYDLTGTPASEARSDFSVGPFAKTVRVYIMTMQRDRLYERINRRVSLMLEQGLWEEFQSLLARGCDERSPGMKTVGYRELFAVHHGDADMVDAAERIRQHTRNYAKRQMTWFRHKVDEAKWLDVTDCSCRDTVDRIIADMNAQYSSR